MNETTTLEKVTGITVKDDLITVSFRKGELEESLKKWNPLMEKVLEQLQPKKEPEIFIESQKENKESYLFLHRLFGAATGKKVDPEGFINGLAFVCGAGFVKEKAHLKPYSRSKQESKNA